MLDFIDCMFNSNILMGVSFQFVMSHLGNVWSRCW